MHTYVNKNVRIYIHNNPLYNLTRVWVICNTMCGRMLKPCNIYMIYKLCNSEEWTQFHRWWILIGVYDNVWKKYRLKIDFKSVRQKHSWIWLVTEEFLDHLCHCKKFILCVTRLLWSDTYTQNHTTNNHHWDVDTKSNLESKYLWIQKCW